MNLRNKVTQLECMGMDDEEPVVNEFLISNVERVIDFSEFE